MITTFALLLSTVGAMLGPVEEAPLSTPHPVQISVIASARIIQRRPMAEILQAPAMHGSMLSRPKDGGLVIEFF